MSWVWVILKEVCLTLVLTLTTNPISYRLAIPISPFSKVGTFIVIFITSYKTNILITIVLSISPTYPAYRDTLYKIKIKITYIYNTDILMTLPLVSTKGREEMPSDNSTFVWCEKRPQSITHPINIFVLKILEAHL